MSGPLDVCVVLGGQHLTWSSFAWTLSWTSWRAACGCLVFSSTEPWAEVS